MFTYRVYLMAVVGLMAVASRFVKGVEGYGEDAWNGDWKELGLDIDQDSFDYDFTTAKVS